MMERMSAHKLRASTQRRESTGVGKTDDAGNNGEMFQMPSMEELVTGFSLDTEKIDTIGSITAEKKVELKNLSEKIATSTGARSEPEDWSEFPDSSGVFVRTAGFPCALHHGKQR